MPKLKTGLVLCACGSNISNFIDLDAISQWAKAQHKVDFVATHELLCSPEGKAFIRTVFQKQKPDRLIIAACSPRQHEATFQRLAQESGANLADVQMANIREFCAWVTPDKEEATKKAMALINAAITRSHEHQQLTKRSMPVNTDVVVIGGGLAGMEAALLASQAGRHVTIIEKNISLGGRIMQSEDLVPTLECAPCLISPRLFAVKDDPNITVLANAEVKEIMGFYGNFTVQGVRQARFVNESCIGCEACFEACPVSVKSDFHLGLGNRKAVYTLFPGAVPATAAIDPEHCLHFQNGDCQACAEVCPFSSIDFEEKEHPFSLTAGAIILATGFDSTITKGLDRLGYHLSEQVVTLPEFERLINSSGPTQGQLTLANGQAPKSIAIIHCAGSLSQEGLPYCSGICCQLSLKVDELARKQLPHLQVVHLHDRLVLDNVPSQQFYETQVNHGSRFIKTAHLDQLQVKSKGRALKISGKDFSSLTVDMVVLVTGMMPGKDTAALADLAHVDQNQEGFFKAEQYFLRQNNTTADGIYAVGGCSGPCMLTQAVTQAKAAAGDIVSRLVPGRQIELETMTAHINAEVCSGCKLCIASCPYRAIKFHDKEHVSEVNEAICRGCGTCAANCPSGAAQARHFTHEQLEAELNGVLHE